MTPRVAGDVSKHGLAGAPGVGVLIGQQISYLNSQRGRCSCWPGFPRADRGRPSYVLPEQVVFAGSKMGQNAKVALRIQTRANRFVGIRTRIVSQLLEKLLRVELPY